MAIPTTIESLSTTASSNGPSGSDDRSTADDGLRYAYAFIRQTVSLGANIASASTITPPSTGYAFNITGATTINTIASTNSWDGRLILLIFAGALQLTHSSNLALPGSANITTAANDIAEFVQTASGAWRLVNYRTAADSLTVQGALTVNGNTTLGNAGTDTVTTNGNVTVNAPSSGNALTATSGAAGSDAIRAFAIASTDNAFSAYLGQTGGNNTRIQFSHNNSDGLSVIDFTGSVSAKGRISRGGTAVIDINSDRNVTINAPSSGYALNLPTKTPSSASDTGTAGDISWDTSYIYVCTASNTWKRAALSTW